MGRRIDTMVHSAYHKKGEDWRNAIVAIDLTIRALPFLAAAVALGGLGFLLHRVWVAVTAAPDTNDATIPVTAAHSLSAVPGWLWLAGLALILALVGMFWPGRIVVGSARKWRAAGAIAVVFAFAGLLGVTLSQVTGY